MKINMLSPSFSLNTIQKTEISSRTNFPMSNDLYISRSKNPSFGAVPSYKVVDMATWAGRDVYDMFLNHHNPFCGVTTRVDKKIW